MPRPRRCLLPKSQKGRLWRIPLKSAEGNSAILGQPRVPSNWIRDSLRYSLQRKTKNQPPPNQASVDLEGDLGVEVVALGGGVGGGVVIDEGAAPGLGLVNGAAVEGAAVVENDGAGGDGAGYLIREIHIPGFIRSRIAFPADRNPFRGPGG